MKYIEVPTPQYVCYNKNTGEIFSIGPSIDDEYSYIEIAEEQSQLFKNFTERMVEWKVLYNKRSKKFELRKDIEKTENEFPLKKITKAVDEYADVELIIDKLKNLCYININDLPVNIDKEIEFFITKENDPHFLYQSLKFNLGSADKIHIEIAHTYSVYSNNMFVECAVKEIV